MLECRAGAAAAAAAVADNGLILSRTAAAPVQPSSYCSC
jgi:hypothetical protein